MVLFADDTSRTIRGLLIPFGELSRLSVDGTQPVMFSAATVIDAPRDVTMMGLNVEHDRYTLAGRGVQLQLTDAGYEAVFQVAQTDDGDEALAGVKSGKWTKLSAEFATLVRQGTQAIRGKLTGAALCGEGAFASAALFAAAVVEQPAQTPTVAPATVAQSAAAAAQITEVTPVDPIALAAAQAAAAAAPPAPAAQPAAPAAFTPAPVAPAAPAPAAAVPAAPAQFAPAPAQAIPAGLPLDAQPVPVQATQVDQGAQFAAAQFAARKNLRESLHRIHSGRANQGDFAQAFEFFQGQAAMFALNDLAYDGGSGLGAKMVQPQWLGENRGPAYIERFTSLFRQGTLTSLSLGGFKWGTKPAGGTWSGNKAAIPSNAATVVAETETATRWAGGHDIAREHKDFGTPGFFESYEYWMERSFLQWLDQTIVLTEALAGATDLEGDNPAGLDIGPAMSQLIDGAAAVINAGYTPTFATMDTNYWKSIAKTPRQDILGYLNAQLSLRLDGAQSVDTEQFRIVPAPVGTVTAQHVVVGAQDAATVFRLPGSPIRAEALSIVNGGLDIGYFGYGGFKLDDPLGIVDVAPYTP